RSASLFVGSTPSTRTKVHRWVSPASNSRHVPAVLSQEHSTPSLRTDRNEIRRIDTLVRRVARAIVPSRIGRNPETLTLDLVEIVIRWPSQPSPIAHAIMALARSQS